MFLKNSQVVSVCGERVEEVRGVKDEIRDFVLFSAVSPAPRTMSGTRKDSTGVCVECMMNADVGSRLSPPQTQRLALNICCPILQIVCRLRPREGPRPSG